MEENSQNLVCLCMGITEGEIRDSVIRESLKTVKEVGHSLGAGTGCGRCKPKINAILLGEISSGIKDSGTV